MATSRRSGDWFGLVSTTSVLLYPILHYMRCTSIFSVVFFIAVYPDPHGSAIIWIRIQEGNFEKYQQKKCQEMGSNWNFILTKILSWIWIRKNEALVFFVPVPVFLVFLWPSYNDGIVAGAAEPAEAAQGQAGALLLHHQPTERDWDPRHHHQTPTVRYSADSCRLFVTEVAISVNILYI